MDSQLHHHRHPAMPHFPGAITASPPPQPNSNAAVNPQQQQQQVEENRVFKLNPVACGFGAGQPDAEFPGKSSPKASGISIEPAKRKRGRPRKITALSPAPVPAVACQADSGGGGAAAAPSSEKQEKKTRGTPPGSVNKQRESSVEAGFTPHVITVNAGEDIAQMIMAFAQQGGDRTVCVLSANGVVSYVTLCQPSGYMTLESNGGRSRSGGLSVSLAGADGVIVGGGVSGRLTAASPVQVVMASFIADGKRPKQKPSPTPPLLPSNMLRFGAPLVAGDVSSPPSEGPSSEFYEENSDRLNDSGSLSYGDSARQPTTMYAKMGWPNNE